MKTRALKFPVPLPTGDVRVSALLQVPPKAKALIVLAHGAGAGMRHSAMETLAAALHAEKIATFRYQFPYTERGSKRPDRPDTAVATVLAAVKAAHSATKLPLFLGGRSFGGRMSTTAASRGELSGVKGIVCFGFPLHPAKEPGITRAEHLKRVKEPMLFLQGTRDDLSDLAQMRGVARKLKGLTLHELQGADHGYAVLRSSGRTPAEVLEEVARATREFCEAVLLD